MAIQRLPEFLINQIKAGEVIERPAALVKELLENSIDAQAQHITLHLLRGGLDLIHIADDGLGMNGQDLSLAFERHATSKITSFDDLYHLQSFGFRGEALASAAAVARIEGQSAPQGHPTQGHKIILAGEKVKALTPITTAHAGTQLWIRDLFYNTPARLKFVRSLASEKSALRKVLNAFLLAYPQIHFTVQWEEEDKKIYPATQFVTERWRQIFPSQKEFTTWQATYEDYALKGIIALSATAHKHPYWFCNQRYFQDKTLHQIVAQVMQNFWQGRSGLYAIFISAAPENIDVNVHPNKLTIKFARPAPLYALLSSSLKKHLENISRPPLLPSTPRLSEKQNQNSASPADLPIAPQLPGELPLEEGDAAEWEERFASLPFATAENDTLGQESAQESADAAVLTSPVAPTFALLHPPERPGYVAYVWQNHTFLLAIHTLLAVVWEREQQQRIPLLVVRHWDCPALFSPALAQEFAAYGLTVEVVQGKIFVREAPRWIMRFDLWMIIRELFLFWPTQLKLPPAQRWALFWRELDLTPPHLEKFNLRDATLAHLLRELPLAIHERYGEQIFATAAAPSLLNTHDTYTSHGDAVISDERDNYV